VHRELADHGLRPVGAHTSTAVACFQCSHAVRWKGVELERDDGAELGQTWMGAAPTGRRYASAGARTGRSPPVQVVHTERTPRRPTGATWHNRLVDERYSEAARCAPCDGRAALSEAAAARFVAVTAGQLVTFQCRTATAGTSSTHGRTGQVQPVMTGGISSAPMRYTGRVKHLVDLDEAALAAAQEHLGTSTIKDTVNAARTWPPATR